jgi:geranylgeranylglycerol-phosphate geranylgeranyltransferase
LNDDRLLMSATRPRQADAVHIAGPEAVARFLRLGSMPFTLTAVLAGVLTSADATVRALVWAALVGVTFHICAFVGNDLVDLPIDRRDARRARGPLVAGIVAPQQAVPVVVGSLTASYAALWAAGAGGAGAALGCAAGGLAGYNIAGKRLSAPIVTDVGQGVAFSLLVYVGAALGGGATATTPWIAAAIIVYITFVNGVHGALRDAANDAACGARTTAMLLGGRASVADGVVVSPALTIYTVSLHATMLTVLAASVVSRATVHPWWHLLLTAALVVGSSVMLWRAAVQRRDLRRAMAAGTWHLFLALMTILVAAAPPGAIAVTALAATVVVAPLWLFDRATNGTAFALPDPRGRWTEPTSSDLAAGLWCMSRAGNWMMAAALVWLGGLVSGGPPGRYMLGMLAAASVIVLANLFNDRCDEPADRINHPDRPLPAGLVAPNDADRAILASGVAAPALAGAISPSAGAVAGMLAGAAVAYSMSLRRLGALGPLTVATVYALMVPAGGWFVSGTVTVLHWWISLVIVPLIFSRECLKAVPDAPGDRAAAFATVATLYGARGALRLFRTGGAVYIAMVAGTTLRAPGDPLLVAAAVAGAAPMVAALLRLRRDATIASVEVVLTWLGRGFGIGVAPLLALVVHA